MDIFLIILLAAGIFGLALFGSKAFSMFQIWKKARTYHLNPDLGEIFALTKFYQLEDGFLKACEKFKSLDASVSIKDIVRHHMADGDTLALLDIWTLIVKQGNKMPFKSAVLYDLSGKDLLEIIAHQNEKHNLNFLGKIDKQGSFSYSCQFTIDPESTGWITTDLDRYKEEITENIKKAFYDEDLGDQNIFVQQVLENYLDRKFWKELCHGTVINQELKIQIS